MKDCILYIFLIITSMSYSQITVELNNSKKTECSKVDFSEFPGKATIHTDAETQLKLNADEIKAITFHGSDQQQVINELKNKVETLKAENKTLKEKQQQPENTGAMDKTVETLKEENKKLKLQIAEKDLLLEQYKASNNQTPAPLSTPISYNNKIIPKQNDSEDTVYITPTGNKYHRERCRTIKETKTAVSRSTAIANKYKPCGVCKPDN